MGVDSDKWLCATTQGRLLQVVWRNATIQLSEIVRRQPGWLSALSNAVFSSPAAAATVALRQLPHSTEQRAAGQPPQPAGHGAALLTSRGLAVWRDGSFFSGEALLVAEIEARLNAESLPLVDIRFLDFIASHAHAWVLVLSGTSPTSCCLSFHAVDLETLSLTAQSSRTPVVRLHHSTEDPASWKLIDALHEAGSPHFFLTRQGKLFEAGPGTDSSSSSLGLKELKVFEVDEESVGAPSAHLRVAGALQDDLVVTNELGEVVTL